jgi:hypothetical protein
MKACMACAWFLPLPVSLPNYCMHRTPRSIHAYYSLIIASRNRFISLGKYYYSKQENHQYIYETNNLSFSHSCLLQPLRSYEYKLYAYFDVSEESSLIQCIWHRWIYIE